MWIPRWPDRARWGLRAIRSPWEPAWLLASLLLLGAVGLTGGVFSGGTGLLLLGLWVLAAPVLSLIEGSALLRSSTQVTPDCQPAWHAAREEVRARLSLAGRDRSRFLIYQDPTLNAGALWWPRRPVVLLTSGLAAQLSGPEDGALRRAIWAHEYAHTLWHQPWSLWLAWPSAATSRLRLPWLPVLFVARLLTLAWTRRAEHSADRVALLAAGSLIATSRALVLVSTGVRPADGAALRTQWQAQRDLPTFGLDRLAQVLGTHPLLWRRLDMLLAYALSPAFARVAGAELAGVVRQEAALLGLTPASRPHRIATLR